MGLGELVISLLEQGDNGAFPGIRAWLEDFHHAAMPPPPPDKAFVPVDTDRLVTRNPHFWAAFFEVQPGDPGFALLHAGLLLSGGEAQRAAVIAAFGLQRGALPEEVKRGLTTVIADCQIAQARSAALVKDGMKLHDRRDFGAALLCYDQALTDWPGNGAAYAERGLTVRARAMCDARAHFKAAVQSNEEPMADPPETTKAFAAARKHDPFNLLAYQGDDPAMLTGLMALVRSGLPVWESIRKHPEQVVKHDQLRTLSDACRDAGIDDFALVLRQLAVAGGKRYTTEDRELISQCLQRLAPAAFTGGVLVRVGGETRMPMRQIALPVIETVELAQNESEASAKAKGDDTPKSKAKVPAGSKAKKTAEVKSKSKSKSGSKSGSSASSKSKGKSKKKG